MGVATPISATFDAMLITDPPPEAITAGMPNSISGNGETRSRLPAFSLFRPGVDADVALAGVLLCVIARHSRCGREREPRDIGPWRLDLDHLGAEIHQGAGAERPGEDPREVDDANAAEGASVGAAHLSAP